MVRIQHTLDSLQAIQAYCHAIATSLKAQISSSSSQYLTELSGAEAVGGRDDPALVDQGAAALDHLH